MLILGIETSCDETGCAVVENGREIRANILVSQEQIHRPFGGVVPELACRRHLDVIDHTTARALEQAGVGIQAIDAVAVTQGPGLVGALWVGVAFAKALALRQRKPLLGIHHLEGHFAAVALEHAELSYPATGLVVSGGHTHVFDWLGPGRFRRVARTVDDAAGEAFDKGAKMLGLPYPGGPAIDRLAVGGDPERYGFPRARVAGGLDFSFSGLKTALRYFLAPLQRERRDLAELLPDIAASYQEAIVETLVQRTLEAAERADAKLVVACGGVAANTRLRARLAEACQAKGFSLAIPGPGLCTDNGAMIAAAAWWHRDRVGAIDLALAPRPYWPLE